MPNYYQNNRPGDTISVNTNFMNDYSDYAKIQISGWNDKLSIRITRAVGKNGDGLTTYNDKDFFSTALTKDVQVALLYGIKKHILPAMTEYKEPVSVSVTVGDPNEKRVLSIEVKDGVDGTPTVWLIARAVIPNSDVKVSFTHEFRKRSYLYQYAPENNNVVEYLVQARFMAFLSVLEQSVNYVPVSSHSERYRKEIAAKYQSNQGGISNQNNHYSNQTGGYNAHEEYNSNVMEELPFS